MIEAIKGSVILVTGATGAIAKALIAELEARGAAKIYAAARDISSLTASGCLVPIKLDVSSDDDEAKAASIADDVTLNKMTAKRTIPKMTTAGAAREILDGFEAGEEEIYVGDMGRGLA